MTSTIATVLVVRTAQIDKYPPNIEDGYMIGGNPNQTSGQIDLNVFKYKYSRMVQIHLQLQICFSAEVFKYKYIGKYFKYFSSLA